MRNGSDDGGFMSGGRLGGWETDEGHDSRLDGAGGSPGKLTLTQGVGRAASPARLYQRIDHARALVEIVRGDLLPRLRASLVAPASEAAHVAARDVRRDLAEIDRELREAHQMTRDPGERSEIDEVARMREALRFQVEPVLAKVPTTTHLPSGPALIAHGMAEPERLAEGTAAVQRLASGFGVDTMDVPDVAARGVSGRGGPLPHLEAIQRSFGRHDVTGVEAHVGGAAATAARSIGADAYATGNKVAFAAEPSLFVAAHEAAHAVQQRAGVQLLGGVGQAGDAYEQHADAVAERVVAGRSAVDLLGAPVAGAARVAVQRRDVRDELATPVPSFTIAISRPINDRISVDLSLKWDARDPVYEADTAAGHLKGLQPEAKLQATSDKTVASLSAALANITDFETEVIDGLKFSVDTEIFNLEHKLGTIDHTTGRAKGPEELEVTIFGLKLKVTGDLTPFMKAHGRDPAPYKVKVEGRIKVRLDPADVAHAAKAVYQFIRARKLARQVAQREAEVASLRRAHQAAQAEIAVLRRSGRKAAELEKARRKLRSIEARAASAEREIVQTRKAATATREAFDSAVAKLKSKGGKIWANLVASKFGRLIDGIFASLAKLAAVLDVIEIVEKGVDLALGRAKLHVGGGGAVGVEGGDEVGETGKDPAGDQHVGAENEQIDGDGAPGAQYGHADEDADARELQRGAEPGTDHGWTTADGRIEGDGSEPDGTEQQPKERAQVSAPGEVDPARVDPNAGGDYLDVDGAARGDGDRGQRVVVADGANAQRIVHALELRGLAVSHQLIGYIEVLVPEDMTVAEVDELVDQLTTWISDPANQVDGVPDDERVVQLLAAEIAASIERRAATEGDGTGEGGQGRGSRAGGTDGKASGGDAGRGKSGRRRGRHRRSRAKGTAGKDGRFGGGAGKATKAPDEKTSEGQLVLPTEVIEGWLHVDGETVVRGKQAARWLHAHGKTTTVVVDGVKLHATDIEVSGQAAGEGAYEVDVVVTMAGKHGKTKRFPYHFTYRPKGKEGERVITSDKVSVAPLEQAAYLGADGRPTIDVGKTIDMVGFRVEIRTAVSLETPGRDASGTHRMYLVLEVIDVGTHNTIATWRGVAIQLNAIIEGEFTLELHGSNPPE